MGSFCKFSIEIKFFQVVVEKGGIFFELRIFERGRYYSRSVCMGKKSLSLVAVKIGANGVRS